LAAARAVVVTSDWTRERLFDTCRLDRTRVHVVHPGVAAAPLATRAADGGRLLCVAAVTAAKGHDLLVTALSRLPRQLAWHCRLVGALDLDPSFTAHVRASLDAAGLTDRVELTGPLTGPALDEVFASSDLLVLPSRRESFGMVITEALARAVPVIVADVGGVREALQDNASGDRPGILVRPDDPSALTDAVHSWLTDEVLRVRLRAAALARRPALPGWDDAAAALDRILAGVTPR
jgi:glycosyltransferase involved in cell wall biosynthesis